MDESDRGTYAHLTGNRDARIIVSVSGPMRSGKSFVKKQIEQMIKDNPDTFWYSPTIIVVEEDILVHKEALERLKTKL